MATAAEALGKLRAREAIAPLIAALADSDPEVRTRCDRALWTIDALWEASEEAKGATLSSLLSALHLSIGSRTAGDSFTSNYLARLAGKVGSTQAVGPLIGILNKRGCVDGVAEALGVIGDPRAVEPLVALLDPACDTDLHDMTRLAVIRALGRLRDARAIPVLVVRSVLEHPVYQPEHKQAAEESLFAINPSWPQSPEARKAVPLLITRLARNLLSSTAGSEEIRSTLDRLEPTWPRSDEATAAVPDLLKVLSSKECWGNPSREANEIARQLLDAIEPRWAESPAAQAIVPGLVQDLRQGAGSDGANAIRVRKAIAYALCVIADPATCGAMVEAVTDRLIAEYALACIRSLLLTKASLVSESDLRAVTSLPATLASRVMGWVGDSYGDSHRVARDRQIDASQVVELANAELVRRSGTQHA